MGLFGTKKSKEERIREKDYLKEKKTQFDGMNMQQIGQIPMGVNVVLSLNPDNETLIISYKTVSVTLPYQRIIAFTNQIETRDKTHSILKGAQSFLEKNAEEKPLPFDIFGAKKLVAGLAENVAGSLVPHNLDVETISTLRYTDKNGEQKELQFSNTRETGYSIIRDENLKKYEDQGATDFAEIITMITSRYAESITEL